jgi:hypothetical protein
MKLASLPLLALLVAPISDAQVCQSGSPDETASIQAAVDASPLVLFEPRVYCVNARTGVRLPSERTLRLNGATVGVLPGCVQHCKAFETVPGSSNVRVQDGVIEGDLAPAVGFSIGFRADSVTGLELENLTFRRWRTDGVWLGGNLGTHDARLYRVTVEDFGRNGVSIVNGSRFVVERSVFRRSNPGANPGAGIDVEPNPGDLVQHLTILDSLAEDVTVGFYLHSGRGRQGYGFRLLSSVVRNASRYGVILNSTQHATIDGVEVYAAEPSKPGEPAARLMSWEGEDFLAAPVPIGIAVGATLIAGQAPILAQGVTVSASRIESPRPLLLAGAENVKVFGNMFVGGSMLTVAPGPGVAAVGGIQFYVP